MLSLRSHLAICGVASLILFATASRSFAGGVLFVDDDAPPSGDGTSWDTAYRFLQDALTDASGGGITEVRVAQGIYKPDRDEANPDGTGDREATFQLINGVAIMGGYAGIGAKDPDARDVELYVTTTSGDLAGNDELYFGNYEENSIHVLSSAGAGDIATIDGLYITGGNADGDFPESTGGGLKIRPSDSVVIQSCTFFRNLASSRGSAIDAREACTSISHSSFIANASDTAVMLVDNCRSVISNCRFDGGGLDDHRALWAIRSTTSVFNSQFKRSKSVDYAVGGVFNQDGDMVLVNCEFFDNVAGAGAGFTNLWWANGAEANATLINCSFSNNRARIEWLGGGAIINGRQSGQPGSATLTISNCVIWGNDAVFAEKGSEGAQIWNREGTIIMNYSCVEGLTGQYGGEGNIGLDPTFVAAGVGNLRLLPGSPSNDAGDNLAVPREVETDLDGLPRFVDDPDAEDVGNGTPPFVDMGAYEYAFVDCNGNGVSDHVDIAQGTATDCNLNGVPDSCDLQSGDSRDVDANGIPDDCQDCNFNLIFDPIDIKQGWSLDCDANSVPDECDPDCNVNGIVDACEIADGLVFDCDNNGIPDECDQALLFQSSSGVLSPIGADTPQVFTIKNPPRAVSEVSFDVTASADLMGMQWLGVSLNGSTIANGFFLNIGQDCPEQPDFTTRFVAAEVFNSLIDGGDAEFTLWGSSGVDSAACNGNSFAIVDIEYLGIDPDDSQPCVLGDLDGDGSVGVSDLLILLANWGRCGDCDDCPADLDGDCSVGVPDLLILLANWG